MLLEYYFEVTNMLHDKHIYQVLHAYQTQTLLTVVKASNWRGVEYGEMSEENGWVAAPAECRLHMWEMHVWVLMGPCMIWLDKFGLMFEKYDHKYQEIAEKSVSK